MGSVGNSTGECNTERKKIGFLQREERTVNKIWVEKSEGKFVLET
jgi:hypothetical protein